jgi:hypothetical protein
MTVEKFYETLELVGNLDSEFLLQDGLEAIGTSLTSLVNSPAQPAQQSTLANALAAFAQAASGLRSTVTPAQLESIASIGGEEFFDPNIAEIVRLSVASNAMTPTVARDFVQNLAKRRSSFLETVTDTLAGMRTLGVSSTALAPGTADLAFVIPRDLFDNHLGPLAKELTFISKLIQDFSEAVTGKPEPVELEGLSSSVPTIALIAGAKVIEALANVVNKFLEAWEKIEKIRHLRSELKDIGLKGTALSELTDQITTTVDEVIEESTQLVLVGFSGENGRKNELGNALSQDLRRLFGQIERGLTVQFRAAPNEDAPEGDREALANLNQISRNMQFPEMKAPPILLTSGEILEGELRTVVVTKKTTRTTTKKESKA